MVALASYFDVNCKFGEYYHCDIDIFLDNQSSSKGISDIEIYQLCYQMLSSNRTRFFQCIDYSSVCRSLIFDDFV